MSGSAIALAIALAQFTMSNGAPRTYATKCDALYYGLGDAPDLAAAYECYGADDDFQMQIVMALNGDGVERDPAKIKKLFDEWERKAPGAALSGYGAPLRVALESLQAGTPVERLVFCEGIAASTPDSTRCDAIRQFKLRAETTLALDRTARKLSRDQATAFSRLRVAWQQFYEAEGGRGTQAFITGSIRHTAGALQQDYVQQHFLSHVNDVIDRLVLKPATDARRIAAKTDLAIVYEKDLVEHETEEKDAIGIGAGYRQVTTNARKAWEEYRDAWVSMVGTLTLPNITPADASRSIETLLTVERAEELKNNILGVR